MMTNKNGIEPQPMDDAVIEELQQDELKQATGGFSLGGMVDDAEEAVKAVGNGAADCAEWVYNHPGEVAAGAAVVSGVGMAGYAAYSAIALGQGTMGLAAGLGGAAAVAGGAVAGAAEGVAHGIAAGVDEIKKIL